MAVGARAEVVIVDRGGKATGGVVFGEDVKNTTMPRGG